MSYSEALEQQVQFLRRIEQARGLDALDQATTPGTMREMVRRCEPYHVSSAIQGLIADAAKRLPRTTVIRRADVPGPYGFVWFEHPVSVTVDSGASEQIAGVMWADSEIIQSRTADQSTAQQVVLIIPMKSGPRPALFTELQYDQPLTTSFVHHLGVSDFNRSLDGEITLWAMSFVASMWFFVQQRILMASRVMAERHARKRLERADWTQAPLIRVVELRRREHLGDRQPVEPVEREWSCQWIVRGHWRQQFYPSRHANVPIWITPYVKGPDDKPLRPPRATVFAVVR